jgi:hypothetical protein
MTQDNQLQGNDVLFQMVKKGRAENAPDPSFTETLGPTETFKLERDNNLPMQFKGKLLGTNVTDPDEARGTFVSIYVTQSGKIITHVYQWQRIDPWEEEGEAPIKRSRSAAAVHVQGPEALAWLIQDGGGNLGSASRQAWEAACSNYPALHGQDVEVID